MINICERLSFVIVSLVCLGGVSNVLACDNTISNPGKSDDREYYTYKVTERNSCGFLNLGCCDGTTHSYTIPIGMGALPQELRDRFHNTWPDGCSGGIEGDKKVWEVACNTHDAMWAMRPPADVDIEEWRITSDLALMLNAAAICQKKWPVGSPGLGGCFDGAKNMHNWLHNFAKGNFDKSQKWSKDENIPRLSRETYDKIKKAVDDKHDTWPLFGTSWDPGASKLTP